MGAFSDFINTKREPTLASTVAAIPSETPAVVDQVHKLDFLAEVAAATRITGGYVSRSTARRTGGDATVDVVARYADQVSNEDDLTAIGALAYAINIEPTSDFARRLRDVAHLPWDHRNAAVLAYAVEGNRVRIERDATVEAAKASVHTDLWYGTVGGTIEGVRLVVTRVRRFEGSYGPTDIVSFWDQDGVELVWFTTSEHGLSEGDAVTITARVKAHETSKYHGGSVTKLTHVKVTSNPARAERAAVRAELAHEAALERAYEMNAERQARQAEFDALADDFWSDEYRSAQANLPDSDYLSEWQRGMSRILTAREQLERRGLAVPVA